jgi:hypothetical protein
MKYIIEVKRNETFDGQALTPEEVLEVLREDISLPVTITIMEEV